MRISVIDSGVGGLCFLKMLKGRYPFFDYTLLMDKLYFPYGLKEKKELEKRGKELLKYLEKSDLIIIACNTLSIMLDSFINEKIISIARLTIEYVKKKKYKKIGIMASKMTIESGYYQKRLNIVFSYISTKEINDIERGKDFNIAKIQFPELDALILGCTHFINKKEVFKNLKFDIISQDEIFYFKEGNITILSSQQGLLKDF